MKFRRNYQRSVSKPTVNNEPSMTRSEFESDLEINSVMARYVATGYLPPAKAGAIFADLSDVGDFDSAQDKILSARALFLDLPIEVKDEFRTADELLKAFHSPRGRAKLEALGLLKKEQAHTAPVAGSGVHPQEASLVTPASEGTQAS